MIFFIVNPSYFVFFFKRFRQEIRHLVIDFENVPSGYFDPSENENRGRLLDTISSAFTSVAPSESSVCVVFSCTLDGQMCEMQSCFST